MNIFRPNFLKNWKILALLILLSLISVFANMVRMAHFNIPLTPDEQEFIGVARQIVFFDTIPYPVIRGYKFFIFSAGLGLLNSIIPINIVLLTRLLHALFLIGFIVGVYRLGTRHSKTFGILLASFLAFYILPKNNYDLPVNFSSFTPTLIIYAITPWFIKHVLEGKYKWIFLELILVGLIHVWFLGLFLMFFVLYEIFRRNICWGLLCVGFCTGGAILAHSLLLQQFGQLLVFTPLPFFLDQITPFLWLGLIGVFILLISGLKENFKQWREFIIIGFVLMIPYIFLSLLLGETYGSYKAIFFLNFGFILWETAGISLLFEKYKYRNWTLVFMFFSLAFLCQREVKININSMNLSPTSDSELQAFEWLNDHTNPEEIVLLSDLGTLTTAHYYLPILNSPRIDEWIYNQSWMTNKKADSQDDLTSYYTFFTEKTFPNDSPSWLSQIGEQFQTQQIYLLLTSRSFQNFYYYQFDQNLLGGIMVDPIATYTFDGQYKFFENSSLFELAYSNEDVFIFKVNFPPV